MVIRYDSRVTAVGQLVDSFAAQHMLVFFGDSAPPELHEFSILHRPLVANPGLSPGDEVLIDDVVLRVLAVGDVAEKNLLDLGHLNVKANGETVAPLPGDVCVEQVGLPVPKPGSRVQIRAPQPSV